MLGFEPTVLFEGAVDTVTPEPVATDLLATLREALSNVARHSEASRVDVVVTVDADDGGHLVLRVTDDGVGPPTPGVPAWPRAGEHGGAGRPARRLVRDHACEPAGHGHRVARGPRVGARRSRARMLGQVSAAARRRRSASRVA